MHMNGQEIWGKGLTFGTVSTGKKEAVKRK